MQVADRGYLVPRFSSPDYVPALADICRRERIHRVFPLIDPDIPVLASHRKCIEATGARLAVVSPEAAAITSDKWLTVEFFQKAGLAAPRSWLPGQLDTERVEYPIFVKPRKGSAAKNTFPVRNARELAFFSTYVPEPIFQEYLSGPEITCDVICDCDAEDEVLAVVSRRRIEVRWGEVAKGVTIHDPAITEACVRIARALPAVGPITVQCILKDGEPYFTEINARLGGGAPLAVAAGADFPRWLLARAAGLPIEIPPLGRYQEGIYLTRHDDSFFLTQTDIERIAGHRL